MLQEIESQNEKKAAEMNDSVQEEIKDQRNWFKDHEQEVLDVEKLEKNDAIESFKQKNGYEPSKEELNKFMSELGPETLDREI